MDPVLKVKSLISLDNISYSRDGDCAIDLRASGKWIINLDHSKEELEQDS